MLQRLCSHFPDTIAPATSPREEHGLKRSPAAKYNASLLSHLPSPQWHISEHLLEQCFDWKFTSSAGSCPIFLHEQLSMQYCFSADPWRKSPELPDRESVPTRGMLPTRGILPMLPMRPMLGLFGKPGGVGGLPPTRAALPVLGMGTPLGLLRREC